MPAIKTLVFPSKGIKLLGNLFISVHNSAVKNTFTPFALRAISSLPSETLTPVLLPS